MKISGGNLAYGYLCIGGIIGYSGAHMNNCSSTGQSDVSCKGSLVRIGGIIGQNGILGSEHKHCINASSIILSNPERSNTNYTISVGGIGGSMAGKVFGMLQSRLHNRTLPLSSGCWRNCRVYHMGKIPSQPEFNDRF